jgi:hypothetical protein
MSDSQGMDISQQTEMWRRFTRLMQIGVVATVVVLVLMAIFLL